MSSDRFDIRFGYRSPPVDLGVEEMPPPLRNGLWDVTRTAFFDDVYAKRGYHFTYSSDFQLVCNLIWFEFYKLPIDEQPSDPDRALKFIRNRFFSYRFHELYSFVEFLARLSLPNLPKSGLRYARSCNLVLERERAAFRFADQTLVKVSDPDQIREVESSISQNESVGVSEHIRRSAELYSSNKPDYRNSIKEAISAVEAAVSFVLQRKTTGVAKPLKAVAELFEMHDKQRQGFEMLYGWTSDENGIRHRMMSKSTVSQEDARYMLVSCSAFANYLLALAAKSGAQSRDPDQQA